MTKKEIDRLMSVVSFDARSLCKKDGSLKSESHIRRLIAVEKVENGKVTLRNKEVALSLLMTEFFGKKVEV